MSTTLRGTLHEFFALQYPFHVIPDPEGGYVVDFPDLPGCLTQVESAAEIPTMAEEARRLWIQTAYEDGQEIPLPSTPDEYSGKFVLRLPKSLHRSLAESAERDGVSLNQYVATLLARRDAQAQMEKRLSEVEEHLEVIRKSVSLSVSGDPFTPSSPGPAVRVY